jgi:arylsulfatase A-like enzyme
MPAAKVSVAILLLVAGAGAVCASRDAPPKRPDILLISIDSLRPDHLGCYGYPKPTSPVIDKLAAEGVRCASAISTTSWTLPAHAAMFTGLVDSTHGLVDNGLSLADVHRTLAEVLKENGYRTAGFYGGPYLHPTFGLGQGFEHYQSCMTALPDAATGEAIRGLSQSDVDPSHADITGPRTVKEFERWLEMPKDARPTFAFVHLWDVHYDYIPPPEYAKIFDEGYTGKLDVRNFSTNPAIRADMDPRDLQHLIAMYDGEIRSTDAVIGQLLDALRARGRLENTLVIVTADHGEEFFEHLGKGHQHSLWEELIRVPMIFHWPKQLKAGSVVPDQVRLIDLMPTILTFARVEKQPVVQGRDIGPLLAGRALEPAPALCELLVDQKDLRVLRTNERKAFRNAPSHKTGVFDLVSDPRETIVLHDERAARMLEALEKEIASALEARKHIGEGVRKIDVDAEMKRRLKGLGYTGDEESK